MSRPLRLPKPETLLHLYRHLLREASYLPPLARPFIDSQIKGRFEHGREDDEARSARRIRQAHHDLRLLRAANAGDMDRMRRVLLFAFGRVGRRRRQLMTELVHRDVPTSTEELTKYLAEASTIAAESRKIDWLDSWDIEKLRTFARSQLQVPLINAPKAHITTAQITPAKAIPSENSWGRPLPAKLARTKLKNLWKSAADKCMPPLPKEEWETLRDISEGVAPEGWMPPSRRPVARSVLEDGTQETRGWDWQSYAVKPVVVVDRPANRRNKLLTGAVDDNTPTGDPQPVSCHNYTARSWRRLLGNIWQLTATMERRPSGRGWEITWGKPDFQAPPATAGAMEFFKDFGEPQPRGKGPTRGTKTVCQVEADGLDTHSPPQQTRSFGP